MTWAELAHGLARGMHVAAVMSIFGTAVIRSVVAPPVLTRSQAEVRRSIQNRLTRLVWVSFIVAAIAGGLWLVMEAADLAPDSGLASILQTIPIVLWETHFGMLLISRLGILLTACLLFAMGRSTGSAGAAAGLSGLAVGLQAGLGHGISMAGSTGVVLTLAETLHLLSAGAWLGGLLGLFVFVSRMPPMAAAIAVHRFSRLGLTCVIVLVATILVQGWILIGGLAGLIGTDYGRVALLKLFLLAVLLSFAALNRFRFAPALAGSREPDARKLLTRSIAIESGIGLAAVMAAGVLLTQPPAMHAQPYWPFASRLSLVALAEPFLRAIIVRGTAELAVAFVLLGVAVAFRRLRWIGVALAVVLVWLAAPNLRILLVPAYPTSFYRSPTGFTSAAIARGAELFQQNCTSCHGRQGRGDGPAAKSLAIPPADLTAEHLFAHSDGELFWWLTHGMEGPDGNLVMPGFGDQLDEDQRWNLIDYIRAHNAGLVVTPQGQWPRAMKAPDASMTLNGKTVSLSSLRGQLLRIVAMGAKSRRAPPPLPSDSDMVLSTVSLTPDSDAWSAYSIVSGVAPEALDGCEFLVDANGWLRTLFKPIRPGEWPDSAAFIAAARHAQESPIQDQDGGVMHMHH
jgi:putative copper export protein/mono/diheme cytochrome c family protein